jgi:hypothetical protein
MAPPVTVNDLTFIHIPKTAGLSIIMWLSINFIDIVKSVGYKECADSINPTCHPSLPMIVPGEKTFAVVRNPWDRVVSMWAFWNANYPLEQENDFKNFVRNLKKYKFGKEAWFDFSEPQKSWIPDGVDYLLHYETLENDFKQIQEYYGCYEPLEHFNKSSHTDYHSYYDKDTWDLVGEIFRQDIEDFGYCTETTFEESSTT